MLESIVKVFQIWNNLDDIAGVGEMTLTQATLELADRQMEAAATRYARSRADKTVLADVLRIEKFLTNQVSSHTGATDFVTTDYGAKYMVKARQSLWARDLLIKLRFLQAMDNLPNTSPKTWSERRGSYLRMRQGYAAMTLQFEAVVRRKAKELKNTRDFQAKIMGIALGGDVTEADLQILQQDMDEQESEAASEQLMMNRFALLANASHKTVRNIDRLIEEGDKRERSRKR